VNAGATLGGSGTVGNTAIAGDTLAPGSAGGSVFGPLTVQGNLSFTAASTCMIQVSPANAGRTYVMGVADTATLGGATVNAVFLPGSFVKRRYTIVNATGGVSGTFNPAVATNMANLQPTLSYDANGADIARPRRMGARLQSRRRGRGNLSDVSGRELRGERRPPRFRFRFGRRRCRDEVA
jgi:hypothetical protein